MRECFIYIGGAILMPISYVGFIYAFDDRQQSRDYVPNVRRRFLAAVVNNALVIPSTYFLLQLHNSSPFSQMGLRPNGHLSAIAYPTLLTLIFYSGTLLMYTLNGTLRQLFDFNNWRISFTDILWIRCTIAAPITEELTFRACSASLFRHCLGSELATFVSPIVDTNFGSK
uniref:Aa_trans domain-containing protein n=1 Tax=Globodera pallida TaxID=36090 RepID=A0A183BQ89_GLOPA